MVKIVWHDGRWHVYLNGQFVESYASAVAAFERKHELELAVASAA